MWVVSFRRYKLEVNIMTHLFSRPSKVPDKASCLVISLWVIYTVALCVLGLCSSPLSGQVTLESINRRLWLIFYMLQLAVISYEAELINDEGDMTNIEPAAYKLLCHFYIRLKVMWIASISALSFNLMIVCSVIRQICVSDQWNKKDSVQGKWVDEY